jgi:hypothetical protein
VSTSGVVVALVMSWGPYLIMSVALSAGIGFWCLTLFQGAGKNKWLGFLLGFALTFVFFVVGAGVALFVAYRQKATKPGERQIELLK